MRGEVGGDGYQDASSVSFSVFLIYVVSRGENFTVGDGAVQPSFGPEDDIGFEALDHVCDVRKFVHDAFEIDGYYAKGSGSFFVLTVGTGWGGGL